MNTGVKKEIEKPVCPKCKKSMQLWATGKTVRHFRCDDCKQSKLVNKEEQ